MYIYTDKPLSGIEEPSVGLAGDLTENFNLSEFASRGTPVPAQYLSNVNRLAKNLQALRNYLGKSIHINSGYRTLAHNSSVNGATTSQHLLAKAADITVKGMIPSEVYCAIETLIANGQMQQGGLGLYATFVHYDVRDARARWKGKGSLVPSCGLTPTKTINTLDLEKAVIKNSEWSQKLGWSAYLGAIMALVGYVPLPFPSLKNFAEAIARWQSHQGLLPADGIIGPKTWERIKKNTQIQQPLPINQKPARLSIDPETLEKIGQYASIIERIARDKDVDPSIIKGIIAAESGGDRYKEAPSGYKGLMQAKKTTDQFEPEISIHDGVEKFKKFRENWLGPRLKKLGIDLNVLDKKTMVAWVTTAYNAGHVTVLKAVEYATASGDPKNWMAPEHYQRALIFSGGYSISTAKKSFFKKLSEIELVEEVARIKHTNINDLQKGYSFSNKWDIEKLKQVLIKEAAKEQKHWKFSGKKCQWWQCPDPPLLQDIRRHSSRLLLYAVEFKRENTPKYTGKIIKYMNYYDKAD